MCQSHLCCPHDGIPVLESTLAVPRLMDMIYKSRICTDPKHQKTPWNSNGTIRVSFHPSQSNRSFYPPSVRELSSSERNRAAFAQYNYAPPRDVGCWKKHVWKQEGAHVLPVAVLCVAAVRDTQLKRNIVVSNSTLKKLPQGAQKFFFMTASPVAW